MKFDRFEVVFIIVMLIVAMLVVLMTITLVQAHDEEGPLSITTEDDWYRKGEVIKYNITDTPNTKIHILIGDQHGSIKREIFAQTDENGTYNGVLLTGSLWVGSWYFDVDDGNNNSARTKVLLELSSADLQEEDLRRQREADESKAFLEMWFIRAAGLMLVLVIVTLAVINQKDAELSGRQTLIDKVSVWWSERSTFQFYKVGRSKKGFQNSHLMLKDKFNGLRAKYEENQKEMNWCKFTLQNFKTIYPEMGEKMTKFIKSRLATRIGNLRGINLNMEPEIERTKESLKRSYQRRGLWTEDMPIDDLDALLYAGEERTLVVQE
jgi:hypothetical protein